MSTDKKKPTTGMFEVKFLIDNGANKKGMTEVYHASTAHTLEEKGIVKIVKAIKKYIPKTMKR